MVLISKCRLKQATDAHNARREAEEEAMRKLCSNTVDGVVVTIVKPRATATELQNGLLLTERSVWSNSKLSSDWSAILDRKLNKLVKNMQH